MDIRQTFRRFNRKHRQIVNLTITALFLIAACCVIMMYQAHLSGVQRQENERASAVLHDDIMSRQDSLIVEVEHLKAGISDATHRTYKVAQAANEIKMVRQMPETDAIKLATLLYDESERAGVEFSYVLAIAHAESHFNHNVTSVVGARGIMQIMPMTFVSVAKIYGYDYLETDITDIKKNVRIGTLFLHRLKTKVGTYDLASAAYNGGPKVSANYKRMLSGDTAAFVPIETQKYVATVNNYRNHYRKILGE